MTAGASYISDRSDADGSVGVATPLGGFVIRDSRLLLSFFCALILVVASAPPPAHGQTQTLAPDDFAYGLPLRTEGAPAAFRVTLPLSVYKGVAHADLRDIAVFNERSEVVPHALNAPRSQTVAKPTPVALTVFPVRGADQAAVDAVRIDVESLGARVKVQGPRTAEATGVTSYVVDGRSLQAPVSALHMGWRDDAAEFAGQMRVQVSDDLGNWRTVRDAAPVANLRAGELRLVERRIELPQVRAKFWRLSWVGNQAPFEVVSVTAEPASARAEIGRHTLAVDGTRAAGEGGEFSFDLRAYLPVDRVNLELPEPNSVVDVRLFSRASEQSTWSPVIHHGFYRLKGASGELGNSDVAVARTYDRFWLARVDTKSNGLGSGIPKLKVGWVPHELVFLARGEGPFMLAFGKGDLARSPGAMPPLPDGAPVLYVKAGSRQMLGGEARRELPERAASRKPFVLWAVLALGVALLTYMAVRLARELKRA